MRLKLVRKIFIAKENISKTAFRCLSAIGIFEWLVIPFGLKNGGPTYQRSMNVIFHDMIGHQMEIYIDDIMVKSKKAIDHIFHFRKNFKRMRIY